MTGVEKIMCDLTCTWTKRLVTWLVFGPNDLWLDLTSDQMTYDLTWTCTEMTCDLTWTCKEMTCDLTWTCKKWLAAISGDRPLSRTLCIGFQDQDKLGVRPPCPPPPPGSATSRPIGVTSCDKMESRKGTSTSTYTSTTSCDFDFGIYGNGRGLPIYFLHACVQ